MLTSTGVYFLMQEGCSAVKHALAQDCSLLSSVACRFAARWHGAYAMNHLPTDSARVRMTAAALGPCKLELIAAKAVRAGLLAWLLAYQRRPADPTPRRTAAGDNHMPQARLFEPLLIMLSTKGPIYV